MSKYELVPSNASHPLMVKPKLQRCQTLNVQLCMDAKTVLTIRRKDTQFSITYFGPLNSTR